VRFLRNVPQELTTTVGQQVVLRCRVLNLGENTVSYGARKKRKYNRNETGVLFHLSLA